MTDQRQDDYDRGYEAGERALNDERDALAERVRQLEESGDRLAEQFQREADDAQRANVRVRQLETEFLPPAEDRPDD